MRLMHCLGLQADELNMKYKRMSQEEAEPGWNEVFEASLDSCMHGAYCQQGADCQVGLPACLPRAKVLLLVAQHTGMQTQ